jgi:polysaccharide biosynthesis/export protein
VNLGPIYGTVRIAGMTVEEATETIRRQLLATLTQPEVSVQLAQASGMQPVAGTYLVAPDGTINLRQYGTVPVAGRTLAEARLAIERQLSRFLDSPEISLDVVGYNSKVYYVITDGGGIGDNVVRIPVTGNETVLDAISQVQGLSPLSSKQIWISRPAPAGAACGQILPVDWDAIVRDGHTATNYQILPGDRIFVQADRFHALTNALNRIAMPMERVFGVAGLGASTIRSFQNFGVRRGTTTVY